MSNRFAAAVEDHRATVVAGPGDTSAELRARAAANRDLPAELAELIDQVHRHAYRITDQQLAALRTRYSDDQLFEIIVAAALGAAHQRLEAGLRALDEVP